MLVGISYRHPANEGGVARPCRRPIHEGSYRHPANEGGVALPQDPLKRQIRRRHPAKDVSLGHPRICSVVADSDLPARQRGRLEVSYEVSANDGLAEGATLRA